MSTTHTAAWLIVFASLAAAPAWGQGTRAELIQQQRAAKAGSLQPYHPGKVETGLFTLEDRYLVERLFNPRRGLFARFGGLPEGSGLGGGPAYRYSNRTLSLTATSAISSRRSWEVDARLAFPRLAHGRAFAKVGALYHDLPGQAFLGLGQDSLLAQRTNYTLKETSFDATAGLQPAKWLRVAGETEYLTPRVRAGEEKRFPSIGRLFSDDTAPGLTAQPDFLRLGAQVTFDFVNPVGGTLIGGRYSASYDRYLDRSLDRYSFDRVSVDLRQYVPLVVSSRSIVLRARVEGVTPEAGNFVPFYLQPALGGSHSLRGLRVNRLRDRNSVLLQGEYRWNLNAFMAGSLFYDAGKVAFDRRDLDFDNLSHDYGIALRFGFLSMLSLRTELVLGGAEGTVIAFRFGDVF